MIVVIIIVAIAVVLIGVIAFLMKSKKGTQTSTTKGKTSVMLTGICDVGKTSLFLCMQNNTEAETCTSIEENVATCVNAKTNEEVELVDIPGHGKVRNIYKKYIETTKCIIFVVSAVDIKKTIKEDSKYLHDLLVSNTRNVPILIVSNKNDLPMPEAVDVIRMLLEKELNKLRIKIAKPGEVISDDEKCMYGDPDDDFNFDQLDYEVAFVEASVKNNDIDGIWNYLGTLNQKELKAKKNN